MKVQPSKQEIIFVTGKGGVGKSAVAAALALKSANRGKKTLLVELGNQSFYQDFFAIPVGYQPTALRKNLDVALWSGTDCLREYALHLLKIESLYRLFFENTVTKSLINVAPGLPELSILGKITSHTRQVGPSMDYDCLVVDAYATGHFLALLKAPQGMAEAIRFGPMGEQSRQIDNVVRNSGICRFIVVSIPEEMPVQEGQELGIEIKKITGTDPIHVFNRLLPEIPPSSLEDPKLKDFQAYILKNIAQQKNLEAGLNPQQKIPFIFSAKAWDVIEQMAEAVR